MHLATLARILKILPLELSKTKTKIAEDTKVKFHKAYEINFAIANGTVYIGGLKCTDTV